MPLFFLSLEPGSDTKILIFIKRHCTGVNLVGIQGKGRLLPAGLQGWPRKFVKHVADVTGVSPSPAGPPGSCPLNLLHLSNLSFIGVPNRCCILELRANQSFVCNFLSVPRWKGQIGRRKPNVLVALAEISEIC